MLIDSNIIIYAAQPQHTELRRFIAEHAPAVSAVSYVEVLGYRKLMDNERRQLELFFDASTVLPLNDDVLRQAVHLRQQRKVSLGDAFVAGTALVFGRTLVTRNIRDFDWIPNLSVLDPFASKA